MKHPKLTLVGAGPGAADLITLRGIRAIQAADVILYDALIDGSLLEYAKPEAIKRFAGKKFGCTSLSQDEINNLIVDYALTQGHVVRLKGGDPFVFGRATEEIDVARAYGIEVEVVPGVSSCLAVPASQMVPVTSRGISESFWVTTGTTRTGGISGDVALAAQSTATVVILMAMGKLKEITELFNGYGKGETPMMIVQDGCTPREKYVVGTVNSILEKAQTSGFGNPAIMVIGEVVGLHVAFAGRIANQYAVAQTPAQSLACREWLLK